MSSFSRRKHLPALGEMLTSTGWTYLSQSSLDSVEVVDAVLANGAGEM